MDSKTVTPIWMDYDQEDDIFYLRLRETDVLEPRTEEVGYGVLVDRDPMTREVIGVEILDFLGRFAVIKDLSWLATAGLSSEVVDFLRQQAQALQQKAA